MLFLYEIRVNPRLSLLWLMTLPRKGVVRWTQIPKHHVTWIESVERVCNLCRFVFFCVPSTCGEAVHHQLRDLGTRWSYAVLVVQSVWIQQTLVGTAPLADLVWMGDWRLFALVNFKRSLIVAHMHEYITFASSIPWATKIICAMQNATCFRKGCV